VINGWDGYWESRKHLEYYKVVEEWLELLGHQRSILDIGCGGCPTAMWGSFEKRTAINLEPFPLLPGVNCVYIDWLEFKPEHYSVITCLQVLEHLDDETVKKFMNKIFEHCDIVIISVPYKWEKGRCEHHLQDPIDVNKFYKMVGIDPVKIQIVSERLVGMFSNN
jgi:hypothetical protein